MSSKLAGHILGTWVSVWWRCCTTTMNVISQRVCVGLRAKRDTLHSIEIYSTAFFFSFLLSFNLSVFVPSLAVWSFDATRVLLCMFLFLDSINGCNSGYSLLNATSIARQIKTWSRMALCCSLAFVFNSCALQLDYHLLLYILSFCWIFESVMECCCCCCIAMWVVLTHTIMLYSSLSRKHVAVVAGKLNWHETLCSAVFTIWNVWITGCCGRYRCHCHC